MQFHCRIVPAEKTELTIAIQKNGVSEIVLGYAVLYNGKIQNVICLGKH